MRNRWLIAVLLALVFCQGVSFSAAIPLRYKMAKGEVLTYLCTTAGAGQMTAMGRTDPTSMSGTFTYVMTCTAVDQAGNMTLTHQIKDLAVKATAAGQAIPVSMAVPMITTVISPTGTVLKSEVQRPAPQPETETPDLGALLGGALGQQSEFDVGQFFGDLRGPGFPEQALQPGNRWEQTLNMLTQAGQTMTLRYVTKFLDFATLTGHNCARLQTDYELPLDLSLVGGGLFNVTGKQTGTQIVYFDYEAGRALRFDGTSDTSVTMAVPQLFGAVTGGQNAVSMTVRSTTSVVMQ